MKIKGSPPYLQDPGTRDYPTFLPVLFLSSERSRNFPPRSYRNCPANKTIKDEYKLWSSSLYRFPQSPITASVYT